MKILFTDLVLYQMAFEMVHLPRKFIQAYLKLQYYLPVTKNILNGIMKYINSSESMSKCQCSMMHGLISLWEYTYERQLYYIIFFLFPCINIPLTSSAFDIPVIS